MDSYELSSRLHDRVLKEMKTTKDAKKAAVYFKIENLLLGKK